jgi:hypothetical protein
MDNHNRAAIIIQKIHKDHFLCLRIVLKLRRIRITINQIIAALERVAKILIIQTLLTAKFSHSFLPRFFISENFQRGKR